MKKMKIAGVFLLTMMLATKSMSQAAADTKEQLTVPLSEPGKPYKLNVGLTNGSIKIVGYEGKDIVIDAEANDGRKKAADKDKDKEKGTNINVNPNVNINGNTNKDKENSGMKRLLPAGNGMELSAEEKSNRVTIHSDSWKRAINLTIKVPQNGGTFKISTVNNGDIEISNINGEMEVENINGHVRLTNISGSVVASTVNGNMVTVFKSVDPKAPMAFTTLNGKVDVTLPADAKANLKMKSDRGEVYSDFDVAVDQTLPKVNRVAEKGLYKLNIEDWVQGKINGGGPEMLMKTMNGNIYVRKAK
jgi:hypothetical protein